MSGTVGEPKLSVVIPVHNEDENILPLAGEIELALEPVEWECIWVDDASSDATVERIGELQRRDSSHYRLLRFIEHRGQSAALLAGFRAARGEFVGSLDGDGQNIPVDLLLLLELAERRGLDIVNGVRADRHDGWIRGVSSRIGNGFRNWVTGDHISDVGCSTRVFRREFVDTLPHLRGMHRFLPTFVRMAGGRVGEVPVQHRPRAKGTTKYGVNNRLWRGLADTFGVRWLGSRAIQVDAVEVSVEERLDARSESAS